MRCHNGSIRLFKDAVDRTFSTAERIDERDKSIGKGMVARGLC
jgi:hypothetical protein